MATVGDPPVFRITPGPPTDFSGASRVPCAGRRWLAANPRIHVHFTPTSVSWMNLVECWFSIIKRQAIHRGSYASVADLNARIRAFIDGWNKRWHPFVWTKTAEQILAKAHRKKKSDAAHEPDTGWSPTPP